MNGWNAVSDLELVWHAHTWPWPDTETAAEPLRDISGMWDWNLSFCLAAANKVQHKSN